MFDAEEEFWTYQYCAQRGFDPRVEVFLRPRFSIELHRLFQIRFGHGSPVGPAHQSGQDASGAGFFLARLRWPADENPASAGRVSRFLRVIRTVDGDLIDGRPKARMPVHVKVRIVRLTSGFEQVRGMLQKRHAQLMRAGSNREAHFQLLIHRVIILVSRRCHREQFHALPIQQHLQLVWPMQALDLFIAVPRQPDLYLILAVPGKSIRKQCATARANGEPFDVLLLREVRPNPDRVAARRAMGCAHGQPADLLPGRDVPIQERRRESSDGHVVKAATHIVLRQQRCGIDLQGQ